jgi:PAS domain S-box-containing protein
VVGQGLPDAGSVHQSRVEIKLSIGLRQAGFFRLATDLTDSVRRLRVSGNFGSEGTEPMRVRRKCGLSEPRGRLAYALAASSLLWILLSVFAEAIPRLCAGEAGLLTSIGAVKSLSPKQAAGKRPVRLRAVVTQVNSAVGDFFAHDDTGAVYMTPSEHAKMVAGGDLVEIEGVTDSGTFAPVVVPTAVRVVEHGELPAADRVVLAEKLMEAGYDARWVEIEGVVSIFAVSQDTGVLRVILPDGLVFVNLSNYSEQKFPANLRGARVRLTGISAPMHNEERQVLAPCLLVTPPHEIHVLPAGRVDLDALQVTPVKQVPRLESLSSKGRPLRIQGTVTAALTDRIFYLQDESGGIRVRSLPSLGVVPGMRLNLLGFPHDDGNGVIFGVGEPQIVARGDLPPPLSLTPEMLADGTHHQRRVMFEAHVLRITPDDVTGVADIVLSYGPEIVIARVPEKHANLQNLVNGCRVRICGVFAQFLQPDENEQTSIVYTANPGDVLITAGPPLNPMRIFAIALAFVGGGAGLVLSWSFTLRRRVHARTAELRGLTDAAQHAILMMDQRGAIRYWNPAAERILGYSAEEAIGRNLHELLAPERFLADHRAAFPEFIRSGSGRAVGTTLEWFARRRDGHEIPVSVSLSAVLLSGGWHAVGILTDITEAKRAEDRLRDTLQRLQLATAAASIGTWTWTFADGRLEWDDRLCEWYGLPETDRRAGLCHEFWRSRIHPDDREHIDKLMQDSCREGVASEGSFRVILPGGRLRHIHSAWTFERDSSGNLLRMIGVNRDITQQRELEEELRAAKRAADAASAAKSEFLANMSHEIRTPMNGVIGMTGLLLDTGLDAEQRRYAETIRSSGETLLALVNDILDISKIEAGKLKLENVDFDLHDLLADFAAPLAMRARSKGIEFHCGAESDVPGQVRSDPGRLRQILINLTGNAFKFTEQGQVSVHAGLVSETASDAVVRFTVRDTGIGISSEQQQKLFQKFSQAHNSTARFYGGTGLGLAISKQLADLMGGEIGGTSEAGVGSEFWFTVRLGKPTPLPASGETGITPSPSRVASSAVRCQGARILVAEDNIVNQEVALGILRKLGARADAVADGAEVLEALRTIPYDLVLMDVQMPEMDGLEATRIIRDSHSAVHNHQIPIIAMTAAAMQGDRERCLDAGMNDYITKPVSPHALSEALNTWLPPENPAS